MNPATRINLESATVLLVEDNEQGMEILVSIMRGFGVAKVLRADSAEAAQKHAKSQIIDMFVVEANLSGMDGCDFVKWLRHSGRQPNCFAPVIMVTGHTQLAKVQKARDCGANFILAKPLTPAVLLKRVVWLAREDRPFIETETYLGPDRRFKNAGLPAGMKGRRKDDLSGKLGAATEPNMNQSEIDALLRPQKVNL